MKHRCKEGAIKDILKVVAGLSLYTIDSLIMQRKINWNYRLVFMAGYVKEHMIFRIKNPECPVCSQKK